MSIEMYDERRVLYMYGGRRIGAAREGERERGRERSMRRALKYYTVCDLSPGVCVCGVLRGNVCRQYYIYQ